MNFISFCSVSVYFLHSIAIVLEKCRLCVGLILKKKKINAKNNIFVGRKCGKISLNLFKIIVIKCYYKRQKFCQILMSCHKYKVNTKKIKQKKNHTPI